MESRTIDMNIGIVTTWFERGAAYVSRAYQHTLSQSHNVFIYARGGEKFGIGDPNWDNDKVHWGKTYKSRIPSYIDWADFHQWIKDNHLQLLLFNEQISWDIIIKCHFQLDIPIGSYIDYYKEKTVKFFDLYDFVLCNTKRHYSVFIHHNNAFYIPWGTTTDTLIPHLKINTVKENSAITFFHSCGMSPYRKGTDLLVKAYKKFSGDSKLIIHAQTKDRILGQLREDIIADNRITLIEEEIPLPGLYHLGDIYVYPSRLDGIGLTIAEALSCGLPVITTDEPPMKEFIQEGRNGKLVKVKKYTKRYDHYYWPEAECDIDDLAKTMEYYLVDPDAIKIQGMAARKYAEEKLNWQNNSISLNDIVPSIKKSPKKLPLKILLEIILNEYTILNYPPAFIVRFLKKIGLGNFLFSIRKYFHRI